MEHITKLKWVKQLRRLMLFTEDAQELYARYGFKNIIHPEKFMEIAHINMYRKTI